MTYDPAILVFVRRVFAACLALSLLAGCGSEEPEAIGGDGEPCFQNDTCHAPYECLDGVCGETEDEGCEPDCTEVKCGPDPNCGTDCGDCSDDEVCSETGVCVAPECEPDCTEVECGPDPNCGTDCGDCST